MAGTQESQLNEAIDFYEPLREEAEKTSSKADRQLRDQAWETVKSRYNDYATSMQRSGQRALTIESYLSNRGSKKP